MLSRAKTASKIVLCNPFTGETHHVILMSLLCHWTTATDADMSLPGDESGAKMER